MCAQRPAPCLPRLGGPRPVVCRTQIRSIDKHLLKLCKLDGRRGVRADASAFCGNRKI